jgi:hypothetical protein
MAALVFGLLGVPLLVAVSEASGIVIAIAFAPGTPDS